jgi:hypothetical protein
MPERAVAFDVAEVHRRLARDKSHINAIVAHQAVLKADCNVAVAPAALPLRVTAGGCLVGCAGLAALRRRRLAAGD